MRKYFGKGGKNESDVTKRPLEFKVDGQEYTQVVCMLGNDRLEAMCIDGAKWLSTRGQMHKKVWISVGDVRLVE